MNLYVVRHCEAAPVGAGVVRDADRPLSGRGEEDARALGRLLATVSPEISVILSSPLLRARRTAELISGAFGSPPTLRVSENLAPGFRPKSFLEEAARGGPDAAVLVVGHQPDMSHLIAYVIDVPAHGGIAFPAGAAAKLVLGTGNPPAEAHLEWLMPPLIARTLRP